MKKVLLLSANPRFCFFQFAVQMFEGRRTLNWKYYQAKLMIEYFQDDIPSPFTILNALPILADLTRTVFKKIGKSDCNFFNDDAEHSNKKRQQRCEGRNSDERVKHANLMQTLINRLKVR